MNSPWSWKLCFCFLESFAFVATAFPLMLHGSAWEAWLVVCGMLHGETQMATATEWAWRPIGDAELWGMELPLWAESVWSCNEGLWKNFGQQKKEKKWGVVLLVAGELGWMLEFSAALGNWPSCCRGIRERERLDNTGNLWCFVNIWWGSCLCFRAMYIVCGERISLAGFYVNGAR
jgi:hypothetical protein